MSRRWPTKRQEDDEPASPEVSRLLVMGFLIAALLGLVTGAVWVAYNLVMR
jgi:hypothetical protein